jgi:hypothetical protein
VCIADRAPAEVLPAVEAIPATDNERIHISFVQAALRMPPDQAAAVARLIQPWLEAGQVQFGLPEAAAELASKLVAGRLTFPMGRSRTCWELIFRRWWGLTP